MTSRLLKAALAALAVLHGSGAAAEQFRGAVECDELRWSAQVLKANPDIAQACRGVFEKDGVLYAKATIEIVKAQGNTLRFRTLLKDGSLGASRRVTLSPGWTVQIAGRQYRAMDLIQGQRLNIYLPEDRFALTVLGSNGAETAPIETVED